MTGGAPQYGFLDRLLHRLAFSSSAFARSLIEMDNARLPQAERDRPIEAPVFVSGLARSGTTTLLNVLHETGCFAAASYRDMPFVYAPILWQSLTGKSRKQGDEQERAHGDGVVYSPDSPEAFEETLWKLLSPRNYAAHHISLWQAGDINPDISGHLQQFARKIIHIRSQGMPQPLRFLAKSNGNIARIETTLSIFPDVTILVPFRNPVQQALSLQRQHARFCEIHKADPFALRYMNDLGHHEFGLGLKWIAFDGFDVPNRKPEIEDWLSYWKCAYQHLLRYDQRNVHFFDYDAACADPENANKAVANALGLPVEVLNGCETQFEPQALREVDVELPNDVAGVWEQLRASTKVLP